MPLRRLRHIGLAVFLLFGTGAAARGSESTEAANNASPAKAAMDRTPWPAWDRSDSAETYARNAGLPASIALELPDGVSVKMKLIPPGRFRMGMERPALIDYAPIDRTLLMDKCIFFFGIAFLAFLLLPPVLRSIRKRQRPRIELWRLSLVPIAFGTIFLGNFLKGQAYERLRSLETSHNAQQELCNRAGKDERPAHWVSISRPFYVSQYEITQRQYWVAISLPLSFESDPAIPIDSVSWDDAVRFCNALNKRKPGTKPGLADWSVRLPTEAEWEYMATAGRNTSLKAPTGAELDEAGWYRNNSGPDNSNSVRIIDTSERRTHPVGEKAANAFGIHDVYGNVDEWCLDSYGADYYAQSPESDPKGPPDGWAKVFRGSDYLHEAEHCRLTRRSFGHKTGRSPRLGFRIVLSPAEAQTR